MRSFCRMMIGMLALLPAWLGAVQLKVTARAERSDALYRPGETVVFKVRITDEAGNLAPGASLKYTLTGDGGLKKSGTLATDAPDAEVSASLERPGFVLLCISVPNEKKGGRVDRVTAGAAYSPLEIGQATPKVPGFDEFWEGQIKALRSRQYTTEMKLVEQPDKRVNVYDVRLDDKTLALTGYMVIPAKAKPGAHPLLMMFNGAGTMGANFKSAVQRATRYGFIVFNLSIHDVPNGASKEEYAKLRRRPDIDNYRYRGIDSPETFAIREIFMRDVRALDYMKTRPEWDGKRIVMQGGSLGGAQAVFTSSIEPQTTFCIANAPALCSHFGAKLNQNPGWPNMLALQKKKGPEFLAKVENTMAYFDLVNIGRNVKCPVYTSCGFIDEVCPPTSVYSFYNSLTVEKSMANVVTGAHGPVLDSKERSVFVQNMEYMEKAFFQK